MNWIQEEINTYKHQPVLHKGSVCTVNEVFWVEKEEQFVYYLEDNLGILKKVYEKDISFA